MPSLLITQRYSQKEKDTDKDRKLSTKLPGVKEQRLKPFPWFWQLERTPETYQNFRIGFYVK
jgi:hypothetical protein